MPGSLPIRRTSYSMTANQASRKVSSFEWGPVQDRDVQDIQAMQIALPLWPHDPMCRCYGILSAVRNDVAWTLCQVPVGESQCRHTGI